jgi:hypothetical protein
MGGLGNQLFILSFAHLLAFNRPELDVEVDLSEMSRQSHASSVLNLSLKSLFGDLSDHVVFRKRTYLIERAKEFSGLATSEEIVEVGLSIDPSRYQFVTHSLRGYFQSCMYVQSLRNAGAPLNIELPTSSSQRCGTIPDNQGSEYATVHARLGDYKGLSDTFGVLGFRYFDSAVKELYSRGVREFYLVSDEPDWWLGFDPGLPSAKFQIVRGLSPESQLQFMSRASYSVLSNSTYALWGAITGGKKKLIVAPKKWFRGMPDPNGLLAGLANLTQIEPDWT